MSAGKRAFFIALVLLILSAFAETSSYVAGRILEGKSLFYRAEQPTDVAGYLESRDPILGWPPPEQFGGPKYDASGSRRIPAYSEPGNACVSVYGDSFTYGSGVSDEHAWANQLALLLGCRVANYGVGGYGSDQATLRFELNTDDEAPVVILGHLSENIIRNVNRYRKLITSGDVFSLKPRFVLTPGGDLLTLPLHAASSEQDFAALAARPEAHLEHEYFAPGGGAGLQHLRFPFTLSMLRALGHYQVRGKLAGRPGYAEFYAPDHGSNAVELTSRILARFAQSARERRKLPMLQVIPTGLDLLEYQATGRWIYEPLLERARAEGIDVVNIGSGFMEIVGDGDPCALYLRCNNHFNPIGNEVMARQVVAALDKRGIRGEAASQGRWPYEISDVDPIPPTLAASRSSSSH